MKKTVFCLPAAIFSITVVTLNIILKTLSPLWYIWILMLWMSGILLSKEKFWGSLFGLLPAIHLIYMSTQYTGQTINIEMPLGVITAAYALICGFLVWKGNKNKKISNYRE